MVCAAALRLRARHAHRRAHADGVRLRLARAAPAIALRLRASVPLARSRRRRGRRVHAPRRTSPLVRPRADACRARTRRRRRPDYVARGVQGDRQLLAPLDRPLDLPRPLARDGEPLGAHPEAAHLARARLDRRRARPSACPSTSAAQRNWDYRYTWIRDASFTLYGLMRLGYTEEAAAFMRWVEARCEELEPDGVAADHVRHRRPPRARRGEPPAPRGLHAARRRCASATPPLRPPPARHLRRADGRGLPLRQVRRADLPRPVARTSSASSTGCAATGGSPTRASGRCAADGRSSCIRASCAGRRSTAPSASRSKRSFPAPLVALARRRATRSTRTSSRTSGTPKRQGVRAVRRAATALDAVGAARCRSCGSSRRPIRAGSRRCGRSSRIW